MAAFNLGGLMAPIWGSVADRYGIHRGLLASGLIITSIALAVLSYHEHLLGLAWSGFDTGYWSVRGDDSRESIHRGNPSESRMERTDRLASNI